MILRNIISIYVLYIIYRDTDDMQNIKIKSSKKPLVEKHFYNKWVSVIYI